MLPPTSKHPLSLALLFVVLALPFFTHANTTEGEISSTKTKLENIKTGIGSLLNKIKTSKSNYQQLQNSLKKHDKNISAVAIKIHRNRAQISAQKNHITTLREQISQLNASLQNSKERMVAELQQLHRHGSTNPTKLFINMEDPSSLPRNIYYQEQIQKARNKKHTEISETQLKLKDQQQQLNKDQQKLSKLQQDLTERKFSLDQKQKQRKITLAKLKKHIQSDGEKLIKRREEASKLSALIAQLNQKLKDENKDGSHFLKQGGKLKWPTEGEITRHFNQKRSDNSQLLWQGVVIRGLEGQRVNAIYPGTVVYADWLTGFGNLLMIDHGGGYMSLYGHNQSLLKTPGEKVKLGEQVATLGNSGGELENALYFEIRHRNRPVNPSRWCQH